MCMLQPSLFASLLREIGVIDSTFDAAQLSTTDDDKRSCLPPSASVSATDDAKAGRLGNSGVLNVTAAQLALLAVAAQSAETQAYLTSSGLLEDLCAALDTYYATVSEQQLPTPTPGTIDERAEHSAAFAGSGASSHRHLALDGPLVVAILNFLAEVAQMSQCKTVLGSAACSACWPSVLCALARQPRFSLGKVLQIQFLFCLKI